MFLKTKNKFKFPHMVPRSKFMTHNGAYGPINCIVLYEGQRGAEDNATLKFSIV